MSTMAERDGDRGLCGRIPVRLHDPVGRRSSREEFRGTLRAGRVPCRSCLTLHLTALLVVLSDSARLTTSDGYFAVPVGWRYVDIAGKLTHSRGVLQRRYRRSDWHDGRLFLLICARHDPAINQGNPSTSAHSSTALLRRQYDVAPCGCVGSVLSSSATSSTPTGNLRKALHPMRRRAGGEHR